MTSTYGHGNFSVKLKKAGNEGVQRSNRLALGERNAGLVVGYEDAFSF